MRVCVCWCTNNKRTSVHFAVTQLNDCENMYKIYDMVLYLYIYIYISICVHVCVCVCAMDKFAYRKCLWLHHAIQYMCVIWEDISWQHIGCKTFTQLAVVTIPNRIMVICFIGRRKFDVPTRTDREGEATEKKQERKKERKKTISPKSYSNSLVFCTYGCVYCMYLLQYIGIHKWLRTYLMMSLEVGANI